MKHSAFQRAAFHSLTLNARSRFLASAPKPEARCATPGCYGTINPLYDETDTTCAVCQQAAHFAKCRANGWV